MKSDPVAVIVYSPAAGTIAGSDTTVPMTASWACAVPTMLKLAKTIIVMAISILRMCNSPSKSDIRYCSA